MAVPCFVYEEVVEEFQGAVNKTGSYVDVLTRPHEKVAGDAAARHGGPPEA